MKRPSTAAPSSDMFQQSLLQQYQASQQLLQQQVSQYQAQNQQQQAAAQAQASSQASQISSSVNQATQQQVSLGTLMTSQRGVLGNPTLSLTKLGG